jgi:hypothetical protein
MLGHSAPVAAQNPYNIGGAIPDATIPASAQITDPTGNNQELGPLNASTTKIGVINLDVPPTLGMTNPNGQVDLRNAWIDTRAAGDGDTWLYFAWERDKNSGSGFISIEFQQSGLPSGCVYEGVNFSDPNDPQTQALIANCNPWAGRQDGDFIITWDQQGNTLDAFADIKKRVFECDSAGVCTLGPIQDLESVEAAISADRFRGEMAINLTDEVFGDAEGCLTFSNVIPGTVTGNSDTADYKDTVLGEVNPITNCGVLKIKKVTVGPDGVTAAPDATTVFSYRVFRADSSALRFAADAVNHPYDGPEDVAQTQILRPSADIDPDPQVEDKAPGIKDGETHTHSDLIAGTNYRLEELNIPSTYTLKDIVCTHGETSVTFTPPLDNTDVFEITVPNGAQFTECVITNQFVATAPTLATVQTFTVSLKDTVNITGLQAQPAGSRAAKVVFRLYSNNTCSTQLTPAAGIEATIDYSGSPNNDGTSGTANTGLYPVTVTAGVATTFYWKVFYPGDGTKNLAVETPCGKETTTVTIAVADDFPPPPNGGGGLP